MKRHDLFGPYIIKPTHNPDVVIAVDSTELEQEYEVFQKGFWWWKKFFIGYYVADTAAGGCNSGGWEHQCSKEFNTREEAREALHKGYFKKI
jgi:hypothetical protein